MSSANNARRPLRGMAGFFLAIGAVERHQGLDNKLIVPLKHTPVVDANIESNERLGGLLRSYRRAA
ncbi:hypothetical protein N9B60_05260 [Mariniblastus sp.]|nr:hypothetical protein [Mariniblastus sp.]